MSELGTIEGVQGQRILTAGSFRLDCREGRLTRDGEVLALSGKPLALLEALMSAAPNLLTKEEIFERVWLGRAVSEAVLTTANRQIRNALLHFIVSVGGVVMSVAVLVEFYYRTKCVFCKIK